jgi:hypothetical protein
VISNKDKQYNINMAYTLFKLLKESVKWPSSLTLMFKLPKEGEGTRTNLTQVSALPKHMSK